MIYTAVSHDIQVAHRLTKLPGKCENIHGHSMKVILRLYATVNADGYMVDNYKRILDFGTIKAKFRDHLDIEYDHRLLLNKDDPWAQSFVPMQPSTGEVYVEEDDLKELPGLNKCDADPTTENIALWIRKWAESAFDVDEIEVHIEETRTNGVGCA